MGVPFLGRVHLTYNASDGRRTIPDRGVDGDDADPREIGEITLSLQYESVEPPPRQGSCQQSCHSPCVTLRRRAKYGALDLALSHLGRGQREVQATTGVNN
jgi:hypothetical protein